MTIRILGTSHIASQSVNEVRQAIEEFKPDIVALELDRQRLYALSEKTDKKQKFSWYSIRQVGMKGFLFAAIASWASRKMGRMVGIEPGEEMLTAIRLARKNSLKIALIDQNIMITLRRFSAGLTWKERWNFVADIFNSILFQKREMKNLGLEGIDLSKVPSKELITKLIARMRHRYPNVYRVLVSERNTVMAANLRNLAKAEPDKRILAIVGAGHEEGLRKILAQTDYKITVTY